MDDFITHAETAKMLRTTPGALYQLRYRGQAPPAVKIGKKYLYRRTDVLTWFEQRAS